MTIGQYPEGRLEQPTRVLLLRHAQTAVPDRFHGAESDVELGAEGHRQAQVAAESLSALHPDAVYCSGMRRARESASPIAEACGLEPIIIPELHERRMGPMSNASIAEVRELVDHHIRRWGVGELDAAHEGENRTKTCTIEWCHRLFRWLANTRAAPSW